MFGIQKATGEARCRSDKSPVTESLSRTSEFLRGARTVAITKVAEVDIDVIKLGVLGSCLSSVVLADSSQVQVGFSIGPSYASNLSR